MFKIREFESEHTCLLLHNSLSERLATKSVVESIIVGKYAEPDANYTPKDIQRDMLAKYGVRLTYLQAWRAKEAALELIRGDPIQSYAKLPSYFHILEATYPGSHIRFHKSEDDRFLYAFVALFTSIKGWEYCRPIVVVDGTFLKGAYKGTLLTANTLDAAGQTFEYDTVFYIEFLNYVLKLYFKKCTCCREYIATCLCYCRFRE